MYVCLQCVERAVCTNTFHLVKLLSPICVSLLSTRYKQASIVFSMFDLTRLSYTIFKNTCIYDALGRGVCVYLYFYYCYY